jgi:hypothetical protein
VSATLTIHPSVTFFRLRSPGSDIRPARTGSYLTLRLHQKMGLSRYPSSLTRQFISQGDIAPSGKPSGKASSY